MSRPAAPSPATGPPPSDGAAPDRPAPRSARAAWTRLALLVVLLAALGSLGVWGGADLLREVRQGVDSLGPWGPVVFAVCYALAVTALLPGSVLTASAGVLFGLPLGVGAVLVGATAGAALSFGIARRLGRPVVARYAGSGRLARLDAHLTHRGFAAVLLLRLVPLFPFSVINYGAGVAGVRFSSYLTATALGIVPGTVVYAGLGGSLRDPISPGLWIASGGLLLLSAGGWWAARFVRSHGGEVTAAADGR
ncbi:TVP38/TMEM64 family protein [Streptomyces sp. KMM 9044]|uniref:TVP38/TMEM64 family protein n=1 Tax=Streptomyces sp. KMM 9044 TaxID=2744474 RepID=UPI002151ABE9|nr:TVP38/TMEM64 family protein [Streptomyces sp. KMM 9044]WAX77477.1 TVP38/TMEM64 family protein [Streptomyces sp. KMM 9044]